MKIFIIQALLNTVLWFVNFPVIVAVSAREKFKDFRTNWIDIAQAHLPLTLGFLLGVPVLCEFITLEWYIPMWSLAGFGFVAGGLTWFYGTGKVPIRDFEMLTWLLQNLSTFKGKAVYALGSFKDVDHVSNPTMLSRVQAFLIQVTLGLFASYLWGAVFTVIL